MGDIVDLQAARTRDEIGGYQMYFHRGGRIPVDFTLQYWGMAETELDIGSDNHRFTALAAVGAGA